MILLETWRKWADDNAEGPPPYVLGTDQESEVFGELEAKGRIDAYGNKQEAYHDPKLKPKRLNLRLFPYPFIGDLENATIFVLMANPRAGPSVDYSEGWPRNKHIEHIANLKQDFSGMELPFESLSLHPNPEDYWYRRLRRTIERIQEEKSLSHENAIELVAKNLAVVQRSPYWSTDFVDGVEKLPSAQLVLDYVKKEVVRRVKNGNAVLIVARRVNDWNQDNCLSDELGDNERFIAKTNRYGWLTPNTAGGKAILKRLLGKDS